MSAPIAGNIDCAKLLEIKAKATELFVGGGMLGKEYIPDVEGALAILQGQTLRFEVLKDPAKDREVKAWWVDDCDTDDPVSCTGDCTLSGESAGTECKYYTLDDCFEKTFSYTEEQFRTSLLSMEEMVATSLLKKMVLMDNFWAEKGIAALDLNAGTNLYTDGQYTISGSTTYVPATAWNPDLMGYLDAAQWMNKFGVSKALSGTLLRQAMWKVGMETSNPNGAAEARKMGALGGIMFDRRMDGILGYKAMFLWDPNVIGLVTKSKWAQYGPSGREVPADGGGHQRRYTMNSFHLPGIVYDITYQMKCVNDDIEHIWKISTRGSYLTAPIGCNASRTGILKLRCGVAP